MTTTTASPLSLQQVDAASTSSSDNVETSSIQEQQQEQEEEQDAESPKPERIFDARQQRVNDLRKKFCVRDEFPITKNMIHSDGTLNQEYVFFNGR